MEAQLVPPEAPGAVRLRARGAAGSARAQGSSSKPVEVSAALADKSSSVLFFNAILWKSGHHELAWRQLGSAAAKAQIKPASAFHS